MKSPCLDYKDSGIPCRYAYLDKNNAICEECEDRLWYIDSIGKCPSSSMVMEVVGQRTEGRGQRTEGRGRRAEGRGQRAEDGKEEKIMDKENMKVCSRKDCPFKGEPQPLDDFDNNNSSKDGKMSHCKECRRRIQEKSRKARRIKKSGQKPPAIKPGKVQPPEPLPDPPDIPEYKMEGCLTLDFSKHRTILARIEESARAELRSPEMQVLYWLKEFSLLLEKGIQDET